MGSAAKQEPVAEAQANQQVPKAGQVINGNMSAVVHDLLALEVPASYNSMTAGSKTPSLSPQPSLQPHIGVSHEQLNTNQPSAAARTAQAPTPPAQKEEPWQEMKTALRKPVNQQAPPKAGKSKLKKEGRDVADHEGPADTPSPLREVQAAAQDSQQSSQMMAERAPQSQPVNVAAEQLPPTKGSAPQQPSEHEGLDSLKSSVSGAIFSRMQHERMQKHADSTPPGQPEMAPQQTPLSGLRSASFSDEQVRMPDWRTTRLSHASSIELSSLWVHGCRMLISSG